MSTTTCTADAEGHVAIPAEMRRRLGIKPGSRLRLSEERGRIVVEPVKPRTVDELFGILKGSGAMKVLIEERQREREL